MNEQTPREPQQSGDANDARTNDLSNDPTPRDPARPTDASAEPTAVIDGAPAEAPAAKRGRGILKPVLIGSAAALTVLTVAGVGMAIAEAVEDGDEREPQSTSSTPDESNAPGASTAPGAATPGSTTAPEPSASAEPGDDSPSASAAPAGAAATGDEADLIAAIDAAIAAADGGQATGIEVEQGGWKVDVRLEDGSELDVLVPLSGEALVREDDDDRSNDLPLDPARIGDISAAAIAAAGGGEVRSIETDDDRVRYEVEVVLNGEEIDVDLAEDLAVLETDR
ncbi:hypothetical protein [Agrococcus sp. Marseille-P2731]|uniref:hypothetical protein n=1 Tax=Agrococcus sp. Marseille-P2731 TaxID=1841862 RepID=UPI000930584E|nr:hypothetical protein [Agrococcus sp. Marseille-P2731]